MVVPRLRLQLEREVEVKDFSCKNDDLVCNRIQNDLYNVFASKIVSFQDGDFWD